MPELLRLKTADFELSIWANNISARASVYQHTLAQRSTTSISEAQIHFSPPLALDNAEVVGEAVACLDSCAALPLNSPLFFENTLYQFEWVFLKPVSSAAITHRSQSVNDAFRFAEARGSIPARLTGSINTGNDVGWIRLPVTFVIDGQTVTQSLSFEVLPTKMALHQELQQMYRVIDADYPLWRFSLVEKTEQDMAKNKQRGDFPLMWLANFTALRSQFEQGLKVICASPHSRLQSTTTDSKAARLKGRVSHKLGEQVKQDFANGQHDKRYQVEKKQLSIDTPENRFIKMVVNKSKRQLAEFETRLRANNQAPERQRISDSFLNELHCWQQPLQKVLQQSFLREVGDYAGLNRESLVLQQKTGYSTVYRIWQELKFYLDVFGNQSSISVKSVAEIYEIWCFLCIKQILEQDLGFTLQDNSKAGNLLINDVFEYRFKDGFAGAFKFERSDGVLAELAHEPVFSKKTKQINTFSVSQKPDILLQVTVPSRQEGQESQQFIWLFDAKYRIKTEKSRFDDDNDGDINATDYVPEDAINQMHRYRDALIRLSANTGEKSRPVFGAFALYPGFFDQENQSNPYATAIQEVGIGAFALLPSEAKATTEEAADVQGPVNEPCGHQWLLEFLCKQIGAAPQATASVSDKPYSIADTTEPLFIQEAARIPYHGMRQMLYPDLTLTAALGGKTKRNESYMLGFEQGSAQWYHIKQSAIDALKQRAGQHIAQEIRYLALACTSKSDHHTKQIDRLWPVSRVELLPRSQLSQEQTGKNPQSVPNPDERYYLFKLGKPLTLHASITNVPHQPIINSMRLTTLSELEKVQKFCQLVDVYHQ
ncbi:MAG: DUF2357 domain-containing protein [Vibrio sp.]|uniref:DUF2357 domain-containing protein n=1 Tax=Vibrio sp. TaxID=678 RepID=UPI003A854B10